MEQAICQYIKDAACGLQHLHEMGLVHRDVREPNIVMLPPPWSHHMLIDLESVAEAGSLWPSDVQLFHGWTLSTLEQGRYTSSSDTYQLGLLLARLLSGIPAVSKGASKLAKKLTSESPRHRQTAAQVLNDGWIRSI